MSVSLYHIIYCIVLGQELVNSTYSCKSLTISTVTRLLAQITLTETFLSAMSFKCETGNIDVINEGYSPSNDAHYCANAVYDAFLHHYGIPPLKGRIVARFCANDL